MKLNRKASILVISLWILVILCLCVLGLAHRVSLITKINQYQIHSLKAYTLAKAGIKYAIVTLGNDNNNLDYLGEAWNKQLELSLGEGKFKVSVLDEERKINLNYANKYLLQVLGFNQNFNDKNKYFFNILEIKLINNKSLDYDKIKDIVTVYTSGKININTVSSQVLETLIRAILEELESSGQSISKLESPDLARKIIEARKKKLFFKDMDDFSSNLDLDTQEKNILNILINKITFKSNIFYIVSEGQVNNSKIKKHIEVILDRVSKKILYYYEN